MLGNKYRVSLLPFPSNARQNCCWMLQSLLQLVVPFFHFEHSLCFEQFCMLADSASSFVLWRARHKSSYTQLQRAAVCIMLPELAACVVVCSAPSGTMRPNYMDCLLQFCFRFAHMTL